MKLKFGLGLKWQTLCIYRNTVHIIITTVINYSCTNVIKWFS